MQFPAFADCHGALQVAFPQPVRLAYVEVGLEDAQPDVHAARVLLYAKPLDAAAAGRYQALSTQATLAPLGRLHKQSAGNVLTDRLAVRGAYKALSIRCVGAHLCARADSTHAYSVT